MSIDPAKTYKTRHGCAVRIYSVDGAGARPVHGAFLEGGWVPAQWLPDGAYSFGHPWDLVEVKPRIKRTVWLNIYPNGVVESFGEIAGNAYPDRIARIKVEIDCEEGEGLS